MRTCLLWLTAFLAVPLPAAPGDGLAAGQAAYVAGDFVGAVEKWQAEVTAHGATASLLAALGNAEWKLGRKGRAMVCWERALLLDPRDPVATAGIRHAQSAGGTERPALTWAENYASFLGADTWLLLATASFWVVVLCLLLPRLRRRPPADWQDKGVVAGATLLLLTLPALWGAHVYAGRAVVRQADVYLRLTPTARGEPVGGVAEGDVVRADRAFGDYVRVTTAEGKSGWLQSRELETLWGGGLPADLDRKAAP
jgi:tetratricopeptide (TPR) repeat protein